MIGQSKPKQPEALPLSDYPVVMPSAPERLDEMEAATELMADLPQEYDPSLQQPKKRRRSLLRWLIYSLLGFGILALAAPAFINQTVGCGNKARSSEGKHYVGLMNKVQQAFWLENQTFGKSISALNADIKEETINHKYELESSDLATYQYAISKNDRAKSFVGAVFVMPENSQEFKGLDQQVKPPQTSNQAVKKELTTFAILCESPEGIKTKLSKPFLNNGKPTCSEGTELIK